MTTCLQKDTGFLKSTQIVLSETKIFNIKMNDSHFKSVQILFLQKDTALVKSAERVLSET